MSNDHATQPFVIAIDGPVASGKGTLARNLGETLKLPVLDTGLLYRAVGVLTLRDGGNPENEEDARTVAEDLMVNLKPDMLNDPVLREEGAGKAASCVSVFPTVRKALFDLQRNFALSPPNGAAGAILDGRDIGTVICPDADIKFFVTASPEARAKRRAVDEYGDDADAHFEEILEKIKERDRRDQGRDSAPLKAAEDAIVLDTSDMDKDAVLSFALDKITHCLKNSKKNIDCI